MTLDSIPLWQAVATASAQAAAAGMAGRIYPRKVARLTRRPLPEILHVLSEARWNGLLDGADAYGVAYALTDDGRARTAATR